MTASTQVAGQMTDKIKVGVALALLVAGVAGFYLLSSSPMIFRLASLLGGIGAAAVVAWFSEPGRRFFEFARESRNETRKVVWPTRKESMQTAGMVFAFVLVMAVFLWVSDKSLEYLLYDLILGWKK
jgi:preprotein translocase subunit SecE